MPRAQEVRRVDFLHPDGWREVHIIWRLPTSGYRARLSLLNQRGQRRAGYDWHFGKGAHRIATTATPRSRIPSQPLISCSPTSRETLSA
jgi:hypothetical protein